MLAKRGKLTVDGVSSRFKTHTTVGAQILAGSPFVLLEMAEQIALTHHEAGTAAATRPASPARRSRSPAHRRRRRRLRRAHPLPALQGGLAVADAIAEMTSQSGRHFDPQVVDAFFSARREPRPALAGALL